MPPDEEDRAFEALIGYVQESRGVDFRGYKRTSLRRRVGVRMQQVGADDYASYHAFLEAHPQEFEQLLNTVLINVTSFFRDADAWDELKKEVIPSLVDESRGREKLRLWSAGCASGEEPYSLAMLMAEAMGIPAFSHRVKIYATDLDEAALNIARHGTYPAREIEALPSELSGRYFTNSNGKYTITREIRKAVIFGRHNIVHDAPISRIDLLLCRNLLIYLEGETQNRVLPRLHYALVDDGILMLGKAETQLARSKLFRPFNMRHRLFRKVPQEWRRAPTGNVSLEGSSRSHLVLQPALLEAIVDTGNTAHLVVNQAGILIFANAAARRMLDVNETDIGRPFQDLPISYRPVELRSRMEEAAQSGRPVRVDHQEYHRAPPAEPIRLSIEVTPLLTPNGSLFATLLGFVDTTRGFSLQQELETAHESLETTVEELQSANEELETTNEELQSTNEELETTNEELQSTNEELETTNEELRSTNEEHESINEELRRQSEESNRYRAYVDSILRSVDAGVVVLDEHLIIRSWNRWNENIWGLRSDEVEGRAFLELDIGLPVRALEQELRRVLRGEASDGCVISGVDRRGRPIHCTVRISPLIHADRSTHGMVLILEGQGDPGRENYPAYLGQLVGKAMNEVYVLEPQTLRFMMVNRGAEEKLGYDIAQLQRMTLDQVVPDISKTRLQNALLPLTQQRENEIVVESALRRRDGTAYPAQLCFQYLADEHPPVVITFVQDVTNKRRLGEA